MSSMNLQEIIRILLKKQKRIEELEKILISNKLMDGKLWN